jgi:hypothetical protein
MEVHVQVERATKALDDRDRTRAAVAMTRCLSSLSLESLKCPRVDREHRAAEAVIPGKPIAKLEGKAQDPLSNWGTWKHLVDEMRRALGHPTACAARAEAAAFARERHQPIGTAARTPKAGKAMREHAAADESLKLALHEQGGAPLVLTSIELPEEGLKVVANDAVEHPVLRSATHVRSRNRFARGGGARLHDLRTPSRLVSAVGPCVFEAFLVDRGEAKWRTAPEEWRPPPCEHVCLCSPRSPRRE